MSTKSILIVVIIVVALAIGIYIFYPKEQAVGQYDAFAKCLASKNITMYGADWCPHCQNEKKAFGNSFQYVPYVECPKNPKLCLEKGVNGYPTWIFPDGKRIEGEAGLYGLSQASGCLLNAD